MISSDQSGLPSPFSNPVGYFITIGIFSITPSGPIWILIYGLLGSLAGLLFVRQQPTQIATTGPQVIQATQNIGKFFLLLFVFLFLGGVSGGLASLLEIFRSGGCGHPCIPLTFLAIPFFSMMSLPFGLIAGKRAYRSESWKDVLAYWAIWMGILALGVLYLILT